MNINTKANIFTFVVFLITTIITCAYHMNEPKEVWVSENKTEVVEDVEWCITKARRETDSINKIRSMFHNEQMTMFMDSLGMRESSDRYHIVNTLGYKGRYQFGGSALRDLNISNYNEFLKNPQLQDSAFIALCKVNKWRLRHVLPKLDELHVDGVKVTESGLLAAAHLVGANKVKDYIKTGENHKDAYGTEIEEYLKTFSGYAINITPKRQIHVR